MFLGSAAQDGGVPHPTYPPVNIQKTIENGEIVDLPIKNGDVL